MKIRKYAVGATVTPIITQLDQPAQSSGQASSNQTKPSKEGLDYAKEIFELTSNSGLYSDRTMLAAEAGYVIDAINNENMPDSIKQKMLFQFQLKANDMKNNYDLWKSAINKVSSEDLGSDIAIDSRGNFIVMDSETSEILSKSLSDIKENSDKYHMLTWNDVLNYRDQSTNEAFRRDLIQDASSAIGMKEVMTQVATIIDGIGKITTQGYAAKVGNSVQKGLEYLMAPLDYGNGTHLTAYDGLYELKQTNSNAAQNINAAVTYIFTNLTDAAKNVVRANAYNMGFDKPEQLIELAIVERTSSSTELSYIKPSSTSETSDSNSSSSGDLTDKLGYASLLTNYGREKVLPFRLPGSNTQINIYGRNNDLKDENDKTEVGLITLDKAFNDLRSHGVVQDRSNVLFGQSRVDMNLSRDIVVDASKGVTAVDVPINQNGELDFSLIEYLYAANKEIENGNITDPMTKRSIYYKYMIPTDENGKPITRMYYTLEAKTSGKNIADYELDKSITQLDSAGKRRFVQDVEFYNQGKDKDDQISPSTGVWNWRDVLSSMIFIPAVINNPQFALDEQRSRIGKMSATEIQSRQETYVDPTQLTSGGYSPNISTLRTNFSDI